MRISKALLENRIKEVASTLGIKLSLDHAACYGGWEVERVKSSGGVVVVSGSRKSRKELLAWLDGACWVLEQLRR